MTRDKVYLEAGNQDDLSIAGTLNVWFQPGKAAEARRLFDELCRLLADRLGSCEIRKTR